MDFASQVVIVRCLLDKSRNCFGVTVDLLHQFLDRNPFADAFVVGDLHTPLMASRMDDRSHTMALSGSAAPTGWRYAIDESVRCDAVFRVVGEYGYVFDGGHSGLSIGSIWKSVKFFLS